jgi:uncharacterized membrane protein YcgQ (UPF0703/DUF1980 family)
MIPPSVAAGYYTNGGFGIDGGIMQLILINWSYLMLYAVMASFMVLLFRRAWVDVEALPFPVNQANQLLIDGSASDSDAPPLWKTNGYG